MAERHVAMTFHFENPRGKWHFSRRNTRKIGTFSPCHCCIRSKTVQQNRKSFQYSEKLEKSWRQQRSNKRGPKPDAKTDPNRPNDLPGRQRRSTRACASATA